MVAIAPYLPFMFQVGRRGMDEWAEGIFLVSFIFFIQGRMPSPETPICCRPELGYIATPRWKRARSRGVGNGLGWNHLMVNTSLPRDPVLVTRDSLGLRTAAFGMGWDGICLNRRGIYAQTSGLDSPTIKVVLYGNNLVWGLELR